MINLSDSLLASLTWINWIELAVALALFLGPGFGLLTFFPDRHRFTLMQSIGLSFGLSLSLWSALLAWLYVAQIALNPAIELALLSAGWLVGLLRTWPQLRLRQISCGAWIKRNASEIALAGVLCIAAIAGLVALRHSFAGLGSDSYHQTLIVQMIVESGMLPANFEPYAPLVTFMYHFGFHGLAAAMIWLTGLKSVVMVPILGQILMAAAALSVAFFTQVAFRNREATLASAAIVGLASVFPAYLVNWGRDTELAGLVLLPLFLGLIWYWVKADFPWAPIPLIGVLAAGIALTHYRVVLMAALGALVFFGSALVRRPDRQIFKLGLVQQFVAVAIAGLLIAPWLWHIFSARQQGYPIDVGNPGPTFFSLDRLGGALNYPTNNVLIALALLAVALGIWRRESVIIALSTWTALMLFLSLPWLASVFMDTVSVVMCLFFPAGVAISWIVVLIDRPGLRWRATRWAALALLAILCIRGIVGIIYIVDSDLNYVRADDLRAMEWIQIHTPRSARFMVNTFHWDFQSTFVTGSDAGYWLPLLTGRSSVLVPVIYSFERSDLPDLNEQLVALDRLEGHLTTPEAMAMLEREGVTYVYIGQRGGPIVAQELLHSQEFKLEFQSGSVYVFSFSGAN